MSWRQYHHDMATLAERRAEDARQRALAAEERAQGLSGPALAGARASATYWWKRYDQYKTAAEAERQAARR